jgi:hypothetical protein
VFAVMTCILPYLRGQGKHPWPAARSTTRLATSVRLDRWELAPGHGVESAGLAQADSVGHVLDLQIASLTRTTAVCSPTLG